MRSIDSRLSKSSEYLVDMAVDDDKSKDWADKGLTKSYSIQSQVRVIILLLLHACTVEPLSNEHFGTYINSSGLSSV